MALRLTIENMTNLSDGGPTSFTVTERRPVDIGRDKHLDWTLPDPTRYISSKHCEIRYRDNRYWLHDVSTNGTFLNGSDQRMRNPHELKDGDRLTIGHYLIAVSLDDTDALIPGPNPTGARAGSQQTPYPDVWNINREEPFTSKESRIALPNPDRGPVRPEFVDWTIDTQEVNVRQAPSVKETFEQPRVAAPRHPVWIDDAEKSNPSEASSTSLPDQADMLARKQKRTPQPSPAPALAEDTESPGQAFARRIAREASLPEDFFEGQNPEQLAQRLGELMRISVTSLMALLQARSEAKRLTRSTSQTTIQATENNPLKFAASAEEALMTLLARKTKAFLDAPTAFEQGFNDLKVHQLKTYAAMQHAASMLMSELNPAAIAEDAEKNKGMLDGIRSWKGRLWDTYVKRWKASFGRETGAGIEKFMQHFADYYDRHDRGDSR
jgi:type VI secretion system protein ImpI